MPNYYPSRWSDYSARWLETRSERDAREARETAQRREDEVRKYIFLRHSAGDHSWCNPSVCHHAEGIA
jgi:hypothetical protein